MNTWKKRLAQRFDCDEDWIDIDILPDTNEVKITVSAPYHVANNKFATIRIPINTNFDYVTDDQTILLLMLMNTFCNTTDIEQFKYRDHLITIYGND